MLVQKYWIWKGEKTELAFFNDGVVLDVNAMIINMLKWNCLNNITTNLRK